MKPTVHELSQMTTAKMADNVLFVKKIEAVDFNPEKHVLDLSRRCVGGQELQQQRQRIQALAESTSGSLKKNVYHNYMQFIETAKEISHLETEMYALSHLLTEQRLLLAALSSPSMSQPAVAEAPAAEEDKAATGEDERRRALAGILEKVEGCGGLLDVPGRHLVHEGDLLELDQSDNSAIQRVRAYLLSDALMLATWISNRTGPVRFRWHAIFPLASLAVVNVRDVPGLTNGVKLLAFPHARLFQCPSPPAKKAWLDACDAAKKAALGTVQAPAKKAWHDACEAAKRVSQGAAAFAAGGSGNSRESLWVNGNAAAAGDSENETPDWLLDVADELDVSLAQRHFEAAADLWLRATKHLASDPDTSLDPIRVKVAACGRALVEDLARDLKVSPDKSPHGGLRAARRPVRLLHRLDRSTQALGLFLGLCSSLLKSRLRAVRRDASPAVYTEQAAAGFFRSLHDAALEFQRLFPPECASGFAVWAGGELSHLSSHLVKQVLVPQTPTSTLAECVTTLRSQCAATTDLGLDLGYQLDGRLRAPLEAALRDARLKLADSVKLRAQDDRWRPAGLGTRAAALRLTDELDALGLPGTQRYITGDSWLELTNNTVTFTKLFLSLLDDCVKLFSPELAPAIEETLATVFAAQLAHVDASLANSALRQEGPLIQKNAAFLLESVLPLANSSFEKRVGVPCARLAQIQRDRKVGAAKVLYTSTEFI